MKSTYHIENIESNYFKIHIKKESDLSYRNSTRLTFNVIFLVVVALFIFNSMRGDGIFLIQVLFVLIGLIAIWRTKNQIRNFLILHKGKEEIVINIHCVQYEGRYGPFKKKHMIEFKDITDVRLALLGSDEYPEFSEAITQMKYGIIQFKKSKREKIEFGQSLEKQDLEKLFEVVKKKIQLPSLATISICR